MKGKAKNRLMQFIYWLPTVFICLIAIVIGVTPKSALGAEEVSFALKATEGGIVEVIEGEKGRYYVGDEVTVRAVANDHYKFAGWVDLLSETPTEILSTSTTYTFTLKQSVEIEGIFYVKTRLPVYAHIPTEIGEMVMFYGSKENGDYTWLNLDEVSRPHWTFEGWYLDSAYTKLLNAENLDAYLAQDPAPTQIDIYAKLTHNEVSVNFVYYLVDGESTIISEGITNPNVGPFYEGEELVLQPASKANDETYAYSWGGWYKDSALTQPYETITLTEATTIYGKFTRNNITTHTVTWVVEGTTVETDVSVAYNAHPVYDGETPIKEATAQYTYAFEGWKLEGTEDTALVDLTTYQVIEDVTFVAVFSSTVNSYTVRFVDFDDTELSSTVYQYGETPVAPTTTPDHGGLPASPDDANSFYNETTLYTFTGWDKEITAVSGDETYKAVYSQRSLINYSYTIKVVGETLNGYSWSGSALELHVTMIPTSTSIGGENYTLTLYKDEAMSIELTEELLKAAWKENPVQVFYASLVKESTPVVPDINESITAVNESLGLTLTEAELPQPSEIGLVGIEVLTTTTQRAYKPSETDYVTLKVTYDSMDNAKNAHAAYPELLDSEIVFVETNYVETESHFTIKVSKAVEYIAYTMVLNISDSFKTAWEDVGGFKIFAKEYATQLWGEDGQTVDDFVTYANGFTLTDVDYDEIIVEFYQGSAKCVAHIPATDLVETNELVGIEWVRDETDGSKTVKLVFQEKVVTPELKTATIEFGTVENTTAECTQERFDSYNSTELNISIDAGSKTYLDDKTKDSLLKFGSGSSTIENTYLNLTINNSDISVVDRVVISCYGKAGATIKVNDNEASSLTTTSAEYEFNVSSKIINIGTTVAKKAFHVSKIVIYYA